LTEARSQFTVEARVLSKQVYRDDAEAAISPVDLAVL